MSAGGGWTSLDSDELGASGLDSKEKVVQWVAKLPGEPLSQEQIDLLVQHGAWSSVALLQVSAEELIEMGVPKYAARAFVSHAKVAFEKASPEPLHSSPNASETAGGNGTTHSGSSKQGRTGGKVPLRLIEQAATGPMPTRPSHSSEPKSRRSSTITFDQIDVNGDGVIDRKEWEAAVKARSTPHTH